MALGLEATLVAAMEETMDDGSKQTAKAETPAEATTTKKTKAAKKEKAPKPAKREPIEDAVVFAFRLSEVDRTRIHEAAGPAKATKFVRAAALAAATGDAKAFEALAAQARQNTK